MHRVPVQPMSSLILPPSPPHLLTDPLSIIQILFLSSRPTSISDLSPFDKRRSDIPGALKALLTDYPFGADHVAAKVRAPRSLVPHTYQLSFEAVALSALYLTSTWLIAQVVH